MGVLGQTSVPMPLQSQGLGSLLLTLLVFVLTLVRLLDGIRFRTQFVVRLVFHTCFLLASAFGTTGLMTVSVAATRWLKNSPSLLVASRCCFLILFHVAFVSPKGFVLIQRVTVKKIMLGYLE